MTSKFGEEFAKPWSPNKHDTIVLSDFGRAILKQDYTNLTQPVPLTLSELIHNSNEFPIKFPINTCRTISQPDNRKPLIEKHAGTAYPVIHESVLYLYLDFLEYKRKMGTSVEKEVYNSLSLIGFVQRLLEKRCASFYKANDTHKLVTGEQGISGFIEVGKDNEKPPLILKNCLSYSEIKLSALLSVSSHTDFINNGTRNNCGVVESNLQKIERDGVIIGIIGARLCQRNLMEFQDIVVAKSQNTESNGYGKNSTGFRKIWDDFYKEPSLLYSQIPKLNPLRFGGTKHKDDFFDTLMMKKRYTISFDTLLLESETRAKAANKLAYVHVVGIGLGIWKANKDQELIFLDTFEQRVNTLIPQLSHIGYLHFSWFKMDSWGSLSNGGIIRCDSHPNNGIEIVMSNRDPSEKLPDHIGSDTLLIVSYAWDGNALPGNEFWMGLLKSSGDSAAACSTLITELHNPHINKPMVNGNNLHIATERDGVVHFSKYLKTLDL